MKDQGSVTGAGMGEAFDLGDGRVMRLAGDNLLVLMDHHRNVRDQYTAGGILLPQTAAPRGDVPVWATVMACGRGTLREPMPCRPGQRVLVDSAAQGDVWHVAGVQHRVIRQQNVIAVDDDAP